MADTLTELASEFRVKYDTASSPDYLSNIVFLGSAEEAIRQSNVTMIYYIIAAAIVAVASVVSYWVLELKYNLENSDLLFP